jgi:hypothetical protein
MKPRFSKKQMVRYLIDFFFHFNFFIFFSNEKNKKIHYFFKMHFSILKKKKCIKNITSFHKKIKTITFNNYLDIFYCDTLVIEYYFHFIQIKNYHKKLYY